MTELFNQFDIAARIALAVVLGGLIGLDREIKGHAAGLRTNMLICLGSTLFMIAGDLITRQYGAASPMPDPTRIASTIVTGVGFIGAGMIFQGQGRVHNLTTAATIWVIAAIGMLVGAGFHLVAIVATAITLLVLTVLSPIEDWVMRRGNTPTNTPPRPGVDPHAPPRSE